MVTAASSRSQLHRVLPGDPDTAQLAYLIASAAPAGLLATAAGLGAHPAVLMHPGMPFALVAAALTYRRAIPKERLDNYGVVLRLAA